MGEVPTDGSFPGPVAPRAFGRAAFEGGWTGAVAGYLTLAADSVGGGGSLQEGLETVLVIGTLFAAPVGALVGSLVAVVLAGSLAVLAPTRRRRVARARGTLPVLAAVVGAFSVLVSSELLLEVRRPGVVLLLVAWSVAAVLWRGSRVLRSFET